MTSIPTTSTTLLRDLASDSQHARWGEFAARYRPMMEAFLRERFPSVEADDIIQETLIAVCAALPSYHYAPDEKGHFRNYLTGILRNKAMRILRKRKSDDDKLLDYAENLGAQTLDASHDADADREYRHAAFEIALRRFLADETVADRTKRIFERTALNGESPEAVAVSLKMTRHAVDQAKSRATARLREMVKELENVADS
ncbi:MAG: sigma-70 family RNA polymerase sigma factor [Kiritimatiellae bacterium]|nr:sigma-70 family RNA polymerase sigma factor [Kiritimatiellia bacterium]